MQESLYIGWALRLSKEAHLNWTCIPRHILKAVDQQHFLKINGDKKMERDLCEKIKSSFWKSVLKTWLKHNKGNHDVPHTWVSTYLWHNKDIK